MVTDMTTPIAYGSLCTGYDGIGRALRLAGVPIAERFHAEPEPSVSLVLKLNSPGVPNVGDIKTVPWARAPRIDILSSGDPCQSISIAGRKAGREDPRFLWPHVREAYRTMRPGAIFFENVQNMTAHDGGRTMAERFDNLREDGYEVRWCVLGACAVGAPHHRHRWYAVAAYRGSAALPARRVGGDRAICGAPRSGGRPLLSTPKASDNRGAGTARMERGEKPWGDLPTQIALLPTPMAERSGNNRGGSGGRGSDQPVRPSLDSVHAMLPTPDASMATRGGLLSPPLARARIANPERSTNLDDIAAAYEGTWGRYAPAIALWEEIIGYPAPEPTEPGSNGTSRRLSRLLPEWMMGLAPGTLTDHMNRNDALRAAGNGVVPLAAAAAWRLLTSAE